MPTNTESLNRELFRLLSKYKPKPLDAEGKATPVPDEADIFKFEFTKDGEDYGTVYVTLDDERVMTVYFGDDVTESPGDKTPGLDYDDTWSGLLHQLSAWRMTKGLRGFKTQNKDRVGDDMARRNHMRNKDKIAEGYYPMGKSRSYSDAVPSVKIVIEHSRVIEEGEQRYRNINRIFLENQDGERYLLDTKKPGIARVYARHIAEGGKVNDDRWSHIGSLCEEYQKMAGFVRATRNGQFNESAQQLVNEGLEHYQSLRESLSRMTGKRGYNAYFENWTPSLMEDGVEENNLNELFVQETLDPRIESVMPILNRIHKKVSESVVDKEMNKLAEWADSLVEGPAVDANAKSPTGSQSPALAHYADQLDHDASVQEAEGESIQSNNPIGIPESLDQHSPVTQAITRRILMQHPDLLQKYGPEKVGDAIDSVAEFVGDVEEIGSSDVSGWVKQVTQSLDGHEGVAEETELDEVSQGLATRAFARRKADAWEKGDRATSEKDDAEADKSDFKANKTHERIGKRWGKDAQDAAGAASAKEIFGDYNEEVDLGQYDAVKPISNSGTTPEQEKEFRKKVQAYGKELEQRQKEQGVAEGSGQTVNLDNLGKLIDRIDYNLARKKDPARYDDVEVDERKKIIYWVTQETTAKQSQEFAIRLTNILKNNGFNEWTVKVVRRDFYNGKRSPWKVASVEQGVAEDLDANQKRVGQLGPTEKVKNNNIGKLVGANENFINTVDQAVTTEEDEMDDMDIDAIPGMDEGTHTQHAMRGRNPGANEFEHDFENDKIDNIHDKISKMLKKLAKPEHEPNMKDTDIGNTLHEEYEDHEGDEEYPMYWDHISNLNKGTWSNLAKHHGKNLPKVINDLEKERDDIIQRGGNHNATSTHDHAIRRLKEYLPSIDSVTEGQEDLDAILRIIRK